MRPLALALALALALVAPGCLDQFQGEGDESLTIRNVDARGVEAVVRIQAQGGFEVFRADVFLVQGESREYVLSLRPGTHAFRVTTTTHLDEALAMEVPSRGDSHWTLTLNGPAASLSRS